MNDDGLLGLTALVIVVLVILVLLEDAGAIDLWK